MYDKAISTIPSLFSSFLFRIFYLLSFSLTLPIGEHFPPGLLLGSHVPPPPLFFDPFIPPLGQRSSKGTAISVKINSRRLGARPHSFLYPMSASFRIHFSPLLTFSTFLGRSDVFFSSLFSPRFLVLSVFPCDRSFDNRFLLISSRRSFVPTTFVATNFSIASFLGPRDRPPSISPFFGPFFDALTGLSLFEGFETFISAPISIVKFQMIPLVNPILFFPVTRAIFRWLVYGSACVS